MSLRRSLPAVVCCFLCSVVCAQQRDSVYVHDGDTIRYTYTPLPAASAKTAGTQPARKDNFWNRIFYGNVDRTFEKKIDFSFIGAPSYTKESSLGLGLLASGLYRVDRTDSITPPSDVSLFGSVSRFFQYYSIPVAVLQQKQTEVKTTGEPVVCTYPKRVDCRRTRQRVPKVGNASLSRAAAM